MSTQSFFSPGDQARKPESAGLGQLQVFYSSIDIAKEARCLYSNPNFDTDLLCDLRQITLLHYICLSFPIYNMIFRVHMCKTDVFDNSFFINANIYYSFNEIKPGK